MASDTPGTRRSRQRGFTLIEVMVALLIVALATVSVTTQMYYGTRNARALQLRTLSSWIALNKVTELRLTEGLPSAGRDNGEIEFGNQTWVWESEIEPPSADVENFMRIEVSVALENDRDNVLGFAIGFAGQSGNGALARPFDSRTPVGGPGAGPGGDADDEQAPAPGTPPGGRLTPRGEGT